MNASVLSELLGFGSIIDFEKEDEGMEKEEMIERLTAFKNGWENPKTAMPDFWEEVIKALPPVEQKQRWIPVSERLPEENGEYLVTVKPTFKNMKNYIKHCDFALNLYKVDEYDFVDKKGVAGFYKYDSEYGYYEVTDIVAWMPLPEPYEGGDAE